MNYPMQSLLKGVFGYKQDPTLLKNMHTAEDEYFEDAEVLGAFLDNPQTERIANYAY